MFLVNEFVDISNWEEIVFMMVVKIVVMRNLLISGWNNNCENIINMVFGLLIGKLNWFVYVILMKFVVSVLIMVIVIYDILIFFVVLMVFIEWIVINFIIMCGWLKYFNF